MSPHGLLNFLPEVIAYKPDTFNESALKNFLDTQSASSYPIEALSFACNTLSSHDISFITTIISNSPQLVYLSLSGCELGNAHTAAMTKLIETLKQHPSIKCFDLSANELSTINLHDVGELIQNHTGLLQVILSENPHVDLNIGEMYYQALMHNTRLLSLPLLSTPLSQQQQSRHIYSQITQCLLERSTVLAETDHHLSCLIKDMPSLADTTIHFLEKMSESSPSSSLSSRLRIHPLEPIIQKQKDFLPKFNTPQKEEANETPAPSTHAATMKCTMGPTSQRS